jgi:hypothetical protein
MFNRGYSTVEAFVSALMWWLIPVGVVLVALAFVALVSYLRRPTEDHDLGQFASLQEAMSRTQNSPTRKPRRGNASHGG